MPARLSTFTPDSTESLEAHKQKQKRMLDKLMPALRINEAFVDFCTHPDAIVTLTV